jgi:hypothetical protein
VNFGRDMTDSVLVGEPTFSTETRCPVVSVPVTIDGKSHGLRFKASEGPLANGSEAFLAATLLPAMKVGQPLRIVGRISPKLLRSAQEIQEIFSKWYPEFKKIQVEAEPAKSDKVDQGQEVGCFFSGGVDSFYTLLKHKKEITKLILIHGFDMPLDNHALRARVSEEIRRVSAELKKPLIEVETNLRDFSDQYVDWEQHFHGTVLASVALLLSPQFKKIYIPSSFSYHRLDPWGSHVLVDPLWSIECMEIEHDGCEVSRPEKVARIAQVDIALRSLRVCWRNPDNAYNCGLCEKCLRTMVSLQAAGALGRCTTFGRKLEPNDVSNIEIDDEFLLHFAEENLQAIEGLGNDPVLAQALQNCINKYKCRTLEKELNRSLENFENSYALLLGKKIIKEYLKLCDRKLFEGRLYSFYKSKLSKDAH